MTDNEIIKALEYCSNTYNCETCEYHNKYCNGDMNVTLKDALDLINRQKAEIEMLNKLCQEQNEEIKRQNAKTINNIFLMEDIALIKAEAVKEFVKKFEKKIKNVQFTLGQAFEIQSALKETKKEMVGDADG